MASALAIGERLNFACADFMIVSRSFLPYHPCEPAKLPAGSLAFPDHSATAIFFERWGEGFMTRLTNRGRLGMGSCVVVLMACLAPAHVGDKTKPPVTAPSAPSVPGFTRLFLDEKADTAKGGRLLLSELNCTSCHASEAVAAKAAPTLETVGARVRRGHLKDFIADPHGTKPGTTMPNLLAGLDAAERAEKAEALAHFLAATASPKQDRPDKKGVNVGRDLYAKVGCVACHGTRDVKGDQEKVIATSVPLGKLKEKYTLAGLKAFLENPHQVRASGRMPSLLSAKEAAEIATYLLQGTFPGVASANMTFAYYEGAWDNLPDFAKLKPVATGEATDFDLSVARRKNNLALKFEGFVKIERDGDYRFHTTSDDGSKVWIDDKLVVTNDGIHPPQTKSGNIKLTKGMHKLVVGIFDGGGGFELSVEIEGPGVGRQPAGSHVYLTDKGNPAPVAKGKDGDHFAIDPALVTKGKAYFGSLGCVNCHAMKDEKKTAEAPALAKLKNSGGCLDGTAKKGIPNYSLSEAQRKALAAALQTPLPKLAGADKLAHALTTFNCYACHERGQVGGVEEDLNKHFLSTQQEMGDEGRLPPSLTGVGGKLKTPYLKKILEQGVNDRTYMHTRMPKFGAANVGELTDLFVALDPTPTVAKVEFKVPPTKVKSEGRHLAGGKALGCIKCHTFAGNKAEGVQGIDMTVLADRLKREWFYHYLLEPNAFRPGTRMPSSWPSGKSLLPKILDGTAASQIEAIWVYLADGKKAPLPFGVNKASIPLIPDKEAIIYRNFIEGAGARAIGVGFPEQGNLAFDANGIRLAMIWQGSFIDAKRHWTDRGVGFEPPLGDNVIYLPTGPAFAVLAKDDEPWPAKSSKDLGAKFLGYQLAKDQRPTFLYRYAGVDIEDTPNAVTTKASPAIKRTITLTADKVAEGLTYRAAVADKIEALGDGWFRVNDYRMRIEASALPRIRSAGGKMELLVPVRFDGKSTKIALEYVW
jgi:cytochrome c553